MLLWIVKSCTKRNCDGKIFIYIVHYVLETSVKRQFALLIARKRKKLTLLFICRKKVMKIWPLHLYLEVPRPHKRQTMYWSYKINDSLELEDANIYRWKL